MAANPGSDLDRWSKHTCYGDIEIMSKAVALAVAYFMAPLEPELREKLESELDKYLGVKHDDD